VAPTATVYTDEFKAYALLGRKFDHHIIDHTVGYVNERVHTNTIENFWSLLKRGLRGTYVSVEPYHLSRYVDEQVFRFNERKDTDAGRFEKALKLVSGKRLTYNELVGKMPAADVEA
jgi:transposase-like protein